MAKIKEINSVLVAPDPNDPEQFFLDIGYLDISGNQYRIEMRLSDGLFLWNMLGIGLANYQNILNTPAVLQRLKSVYSKHPVYPDEIRFPVP